MLRKAVLIVCSLGFVSAWQTDARATVMVEVLLEDMVRDAEAIVVGRVSGSEVRLALTDRGSEIHTLTTVEVRQWLKGAGDASVTLREYGGELQGIGTRIDGTPRYSIGDHVLLFLERSPSDARHYRTYAMSQGKFSIRYGVGSIPTTVFRDFAGIGFANWSRGRMAVTSQGREPAVALSSMIELIDGVLERVRVR